VASSRERLRIAGEQELALGPLTQDAATDLFVARAQAVDLGFAATGANREAIQRICERLGGFPLAIELAAARTNVLTPAQIATRLDSSLLGASGEGSRDAPGRHQTLNAAIAWSYDLLGEGERELLARLGVFAGGFDVEPAEAVGGEVLGPLGSLVDKSLVRRTMLAETLRFELLEAIREFALERLNEGGADDDARALHAEYYLALAERAEPELRGAGQRDWLRRLGLEHENLRTAYAWWSERDAHSEALRLAVALGPFWEQRGTLSEPRSWLQEGLAADDIAPTLRARALYTLGRLAMLQADYERAGSALGEARDVFRELGADDGAMRCMWELGFVALVAGDYERSRGLYEESLAIARALGDDGAASRSLAGLGRALLEGGDAEAARAPLRESLAIRRAREAPRDTANSLSLLGRCALLAGDFNEARASLDEAVALARELDDQLRLAEALYFLALVELERGGPGSADALLEERLLLCRDLGDRLGIAECLDAEARTAAAEERDDEAARLLAAAEKLRSSVGARAWPFELARREATLELVRQRLGDQAFADATLDGSALSTDQGVTLALGRTSA
jgi:tetratricopeptide (TPR) repeat protein